MEPHHVHGGILWDGWVLMLPGVFVAADAITSPTHAAQSNVIHAFAH